MVLTFQVAETGTYKLYSQFTKARDFGIVKVSLDDRELIDSLDLYHYPDVVSDGLILLTETRLEAGDHHLKLEIVGANQAAVPAFRVGIDVLVPVLQESP